MDCSDPALLHSAARSNDLEAAELLLKEKGINVYATDEKGMTALHILIQKRIEKNDSVPTSWREKYSSNDEKIPDKFIDMLLKHTSTDFNQTDDMRLLEFDAACTLESCATAESLLETIDDVNQSIDENSPIWPGFTCLHFAAHCNVDTVKMLIDKGGNLLSCDAAGATPLEICIKTFQLEEVQSILMSVTAWKDILFSDGKTKLMDYISVLHDKDSHNTFLQSMGKDIGVSLSNNSPLWPGSTILHIAVTLIREPKSYPIISDILHRRADVTAPDSHGSTPIHLAFRLHQHNMHILNMLFPCHKKFLNPVDRDNLSHLHIASAENYTGIVTRLSSIEASIDIAYTGKPLSTIKPGWTPLHVACFTERSVVVRTLVSRGASLLKADAEGFTAIHRLFGTSGRKKAILDLLVDSKQFKDCVVEGIGLTHLHVMAYWNKVKTVERLLDSGADIDAVIGEVEDENLKKFVGCTPLRLAVMNGHLQTVEVLLKRGADVLIKKSDGTSALLDVLTGKYDESLLGMFVSRLWTNKKLQERMKREMGLTMLHIVCRILDLKKIKDLLRKNVNVDARIRDDSPIWPGFTPLHVLALTGSTLARHAGGQVKLDEPLKLLLDKKANVAVTDVKGDTPVHLTLKNLHNVELGKCRASSMIACHRDFSVNPTSDEGISHFHMACWTCASTTVEGFLKHGVDVNQPIVAGNFAGKTPLHLALNARAKRIDGGAPQLRVVELLLKHGANIDAVDPGGWTPLHTVAKCGSPRQELLNVIVRADTDINIETFDGQTPFEILIKNGATIKEIKYFIDHGSRINSYNRINNIGYMALILSNTRYEKLSNSIFKLMMSLPDITEIDERGRNAIYNTFSDRQRHFNIRELEILLEKLVKLGCDVNHQDHSGKTPLHLAVELRNERVVSLLLKCGADVNLMDSAGQSPFVHSIEYMRRGSFDSYVMVTLGRHLAKRRLVGLEISELNFRCLNSVVMPALSEAEKKSLRDQVEKTKKMKIGNRGLTLYDFVFEKNVLKIISSFTSVERDIVGKVLESINYDTFEALSDLLKLQYRKVMQRLLLITPAAESLIALLRFPLPQLCVEAVLKFLSNIELKCLVFASIKNDDSVMNIE